jgi:hypothetical protein
LIRYITADTAPWSQPGIRKSKRMKRNQRMKKKKRREMKIEPPKPQKRKFEESKFSAREKASKEKRKKETGPKKPPPAILGEEEEEEEEETKIEPSKPQKRKFEESKFSPHENKALKEKRIKETGPRKLPPAILQSVDHGLGVVVVDMEFEEAAQALVSVGRPKQNLHRLPTFGGGSSRVPRAAQGAVGTYDDNKWKAHQKFNNKAKVECRLVSILSLYYETPFFLNLTCAHRAGRFSPKL